MKIDTERFAIGVLSVAALLWTLNASAELTNGGFESGHITPWIGATDDQIDADSAHDGVYGARVTSSMTVSQDRDTVAGMQYVFRGWYRCTDFNLNGGWGYDHLTVVDNSANPWRNIAWVRNLNERERGVWRRIAITFVAPGPRVRLSFGLFASAEATAELSFDSFEFFEKTVNLPPTVDPGADPAAGAAPLAVQFTANADDPDGAVTAVQWDFGDGSTAIEDGASHTYIQKGEYLVKLRAWDNDGALVAAEFPISVIGDDNPTVTVTSPTTTDTQESCIELAGEASAPGGRVLISLVWDNLGTDDAAEIPIPAEPSASWSTQSLRLKPGRNEILFTVTDSEGRVGTRSVAVNRLVAGPEVSNPTLTPEEPRVFEMVEIGFDLETTAEHSLYGYDASPPPGVTPETGVTVEGVIDTPAGEIRQPGFHSRDVERVVSGERKYYKDTGRERWLIRFSPQAAGNHSVRIHVRDRSGSAEVPVGSFVAQPARGKGYVGVSPHDTRYFSFSNGALFWPVGPATGPDYSVYAGSGQNIERPWMAGRGAYSTNWARWHSSALVSGNEGYDNPFSFREHFPSHELSRELYAPGGRVIRIGFGDDDFRHRMTTGATYLLKLRVKVVDLAGPIEAGVPHGLMIKTHGWVDDLESLPEETRARPSLITPVSCDRDWHTIVAAFTATSSDAANTFISLFLDNVSSGRAFIDRFSIKEWDGSEAGGELIRQPLSDLHAYVEQRPAAYFDDQVRQGEENDVFFKFVVHDKRDWIQNHLLRTGTFADSGHGYSQPEGTRARWLLEQWWRYVAARWGYSTAVHSWELMNEGSPTDPAHYRQADDFGRYMGRTDSHPHLTTTSFWCCWEPELWGGADYPHVAYADIHDYTEDSANGLDMASYVADYWGAQVTAEPVGKPVMMGETGIGYKGQVYYDELDQPNSGIWYHNLLWAGLSPAAITAPNYWWMEHFERIDRRSISRVFRQFVDRLKLHQGGYADASATVSTSNGDLRAIGQKNVAAGHAHLWLQNRAHTWRNVLFGTVTAIQSASVTIRMAPSTDYRVEWFNTYTGAVTSAAQTSDSSGSLILTLSDFSDDVAVRIFSLAEASPPPPRGFRVR
ncbi:MAG: PKD domain-containing protein [Vicinamibacteria bacterium]|nr:PKD domain-containing protein [Vicinamibacteria bacterium]